MENVRRTIKIIVHTSTNLEFTDRSRSHYTQKFKDFLIDKDEEVRSQLIIPINNEVGLFNWAIDFIENPFDGFFVDIFCDNDESLRKIIAIIIERLGNNGLSFYSKGPINTQP